MKKLLTILMAILFLVTPIAFAEEVATNVSSEVTPEETQVVTQTTDVATEPNLIATQETSSDLSETESNDITQTIEASEGTETPIETSITPDMPVRWGLKRITEKINLFFTFNKTKQAEKKLNFARERLQEMKQMSEKKNLKALAKAQKAHATLISELARDEEVLADEDLEAADKVEIELQKHIQVLEGVQAKLTAKGVPTQGIENALVNSRKALDKFNSLNETRKAKVAEKLVNKAEKVSEKRTEKKQAEQTTEEKTSETEKTEIVEGESTDTETAEILSEQISE